MRVDFCTYPQIKIKHYLFILILCTGFFISQNTSAEVINIPIQRSVATQPVTSLEIIAIVKSLLNGRVLSIKKLSSYSNPDCHQVKLLEDEGEFQIIKLGCYTDSIVQTEPE